ncbi:MAG: hypothetical protein L0Z62_11335, partial [Gemmataceae bacterium]|nr:hypothetical protein [Gemmataceae bacterium]
MTEMTPVEALFFAALQKPTPQERAAYLERACGGDADLRQRVERLRARGDAGGRDEAGVRHRRGRRGRAERSA